MKKLTIILVTLLILAGCDSEDWKIVNQSGNIKFIEMKSSANNKDVYRNAIPKICQKTEECKLLFWNKGEAPLSLPLSDTDIQSMIAYYANQLTPKKQNLRWNCEIFTDTTKSICLDKEFIRNEITD